MRARRYFIDEQFTLPCAEELNGQHATVVHGISQLPGHADGRFCDGSVRAGRDHGGGKHTVVVAVFTDRINGCLAVDVAYQYNRNFTLQVNHLFKYTGCPAHLREGKAYFIRRACLYLALAVIAHGSCLE